MSTYDAVSDIIASVISKLKMDTGVRKQVHK